MWTISRERCWPDYPSPPRTKPAASAPGRQRPPTSRGYRQTTGGGRSSQRPREPRAAPPVVLSRGPTHSDDDQKVVVAGMPGRSGTGGWGLCRSPTGHDRGGSIVATCLPNGGSGETASTPCPIRRPPSGLQTCPVGDGRDENRPCTGAPTWRWPPGPASPGGGPKVYRASRGVGARSQGHKIASERSI